MHCLECDKEDKNLTVGSSTCKYCGFDNIHVLKLLNGSEDDVEEEEILEDEFRTAQEIAARSLIIISLLSVVYRSNVDETINWLKDTKLWDQLSPVEMEFINNIKNEKLEIEISWRSEALISLLWSINIINELPSLNDQVDTSHIIKSLTMTTNKAKQFIESAVLRDENEIEEAYNTIYDSHWTIRDAQINNKSIPNNLNPSVTYERHYGFNYVIGYGSQPWDEICVDT